MKKQIVKLIPKSVREGLKQLLYGKQIDEVMMVFKLLEKFDMPAKIMIDVGAHYGGSLVPFAKKRWKVFAVEPDNANRNRLVENLKAEGINSVDIDPRALSDEPGKLTLYKSGVSSGISGLLNFHPSHVKSEDVDVITLNTFCKEKNIDKVDFLKIDTEGFDLKVLKGIDLKHYSPEAIVCEFENNKSRKLGYVLEDVISYLSAGGYKILLSEWYPIVEYGRRHKWKQFVTDASRVDEKGWGNVIAVKDRYMSELLKLTSKR